MKREFLLYTCLSFCSLRSSAFCFGCLLPLFAALYSLEQARYDREARQLDVRNIITEATSRPYVPSIV